VKGKEDRRSYLSDSNLLAKKKNFCKYGYQLQREETVERKIRVLKADGGGNWGAKRDQSPIAYKLLKRKGDLIIGVRKSWVNVIWFPFLWRELLLSFLLIYHSDPLIFLIQETDSFFLSLFSSDKENKIIKTKKIKLQKIVGECNVFFIKTKTLGHSTQQKIFV
jgi:hypothetical protein